MIYSGIYKWTNPKGRIYIGQSEDLLDRKDDYKSFSRTVKQPRIHRSIQKYGIEAHVWEVIELCCIDKLDERERHWQEFYDVLSSMGMNCVLKDTGEKRRVISQVMKDRLRKINTGKTLSEETKEKLRISGRKRKHSEETKLKMSTGKKGIPKSEEHKAKLRGRTFSEEHKLKISIAATGRFVSEETRKKLSVASINRYSSVSQYSLEDKFITEWESAAAANRELKIDGSSILKCCKGKKRMAGGFKWKY